MVFNNLKTPAATAQAILKAASKYRILAIFENFRHISWNTRYSQTWFTVMRFTMVLSRLAIVLTEEYDAKIGSLIKSLRLYFDAFE